MSLGQLHACLIIHSNPPEQWKAIEGKGLGDRKEKELLFLETFQSFR